MHTLALLLSLALPLAPPPTSSSPSQEQHHHGGGEGAHGNPADLASYVASMEDPARDAWQKPADVLAALHLKPGMTLCDVGVGPGYFALRAAPLLTDQGRVLAVDVEPAMLEALTQRMVAGKIRNITPVLGLPDSPLLPNASCDVILVVDTYHHLGDRKAYLGQLLAALKRGGRLALIDFHKKDLPVGPPKEHKLSREQVLEEARAAGFKPVEEPALLPYQYFLLLAGRG